MPDSKTKGCGKEYGSYAIHGRFCQEHGIVPKPACSEPTMVMAPTQNTMLAVTNPSAKVASPSPYFYKLFLLFFPPLG